MLLHKNFDNYLPRFILFSTMANTASHSVCVCLQKCAKGHKGARWASQPRLRQRGVYAGNFLLATNILLSGNNFAKVALLMQFMRLGMIARSDFNRVQSLYAVPAILEYWGELSAATIHGLQGKSIVLAGKQCNVVCF